MNRLVEIRSYQLKPGSGARFHDLVRNKSVPLQKAWGLDVVAYGQSLHDPDAYFLIRSFDGPAQLQTSLDGFYASDDWRNGPRSGIVELIESDANAMFWLALEAVAAMSRSYASSP